MHLTRSFHLKHFINAIKLLTCSSILHITATLWLQLAVVAGRSLALDAVGNCSVCPFHGCVRLLLAWQAQAVVDRLSGFTFKPPVFEGRLTGKLVCKTIQRWSCFHCFEISWEPCFVQKQQRHEHLSS